MSMSKIGVVLVLASLGLLVTGCAGHIKQLPDGRHLSATTAGDTPDRSATYVQILEDDGNGGYKEVAGDLTVGPTIAGQATIGILNGTGAAYIQGEALKDAANAKASALRCPDGTTNCHSTVIGVGGAEAVAGSSASSQSGVKFNADLFRGCPSGNCVSVPMQ